jgi:hypothetical protein
LLLSNESSGLGALSSTVELLFENRFCCESGCLRREGLWEREESEKREGGDSAFVRTGEYITEDSASVLGILINMLLQKAR